MKKSSIDSLLRIIKSINDNEIKSKNTEKKKRERLVNKVLIFGTIIPIVLAFISYLFIMLNICNKLSLWAFMILQFLAYLNTIIVSPLISNRKLLISFFKNPFSIFLDKVRLLCEIDVSHTKDLQRKSKLELQFLKIELQTEKNAIEKKISLLVGNIDKVGMFPGLIAVGIAAYTKLSPGTSLFSHFLYFITLSTPILYLVGYVIHMVCLRAERIIALIDIIVENKAEK